MTPKLVLSVLWEIALPGGVAAMRLYYGAQGENVISGAWWRDAESPARLPVARIVLAEQAG
jgi:hypothetical protein